MAAATTERATKSRNLGDKYELPMAAEKVWAGTLVMMNAAGFLSKAQADAGNKGCWGVATKTVDNSGGSAGDLDLEIQEGEFLFAGDTLAQTGVGGVVYADDDQTIDETQATNCPQAGKLVRLVSASSGWVKVGAALAS